MTRLRLNSATAWWCAGLFAACVGSAATAAAHPLWSTVSESSRTPSLNGAFLHNQPLRVLILGERATQWQRNRALEISMLTDYARARHLTLEWVEVFRPIDLYQKLLRGEGDIAIGTLSPELEQEPSVTRTHPLATERYQLIGRADLQAKSPLELAGMHIAARLSSPLWSYLEKLRETVPNLQLEALPPNLDRDTALRYVADGDYDAAVLPTTMAADDLSAYPRLKRLFDLTDNEPIGWYVRSDQRDLLLGLNRFIERYHTAYFDPIAAPRDFDAIKKRGVLRILTRVDAQNYFVDGGSPAGYEFELAKNFAEAHALALEVLVADSDNQLLQWLKDGVGDIITTRLANSEFRGDPSVRASRRYHYNAYALLTRRAAPDAEPKSTRQKLVAAYEDSSELRALRSLPAEVSVLHVIAAAPTVPKQTLLDRLGQGQIDAIVVDPVESRQLLTARPDLVVGASIPHQFDYRWIVRGSDESMLQAVNQFLVDAHRNGMNAVLAARYFAPHCRTQIAKSETQPISPYDRIVQTYADQYDFDWRLIAAQIYQESQFDPSAVSAGGARGLMQMLPSTAKSLGFENLSRPDSSIHAGVKYLYTLRSEFEDGVPVSERTWFALAAYNVGIERVVRARQMAEKLNLDPNKWFGNVELAMLQFARSSREGAGSCGQAIIYVRQIQSLYGAYRHLRTAATPGAVTELSNLPLTSLLEPTKSTSYALR